MAIWASGGAGVLVAPPVGVATRLGRGPVTTPFLAGKIARERWLTSIHRVILSHVQAKVRLLFQIDQKREMILRVPFFSCFFFLNLR